MNLKKTMNPLQTARVVKEERERERGEEEVYMTRMTNRTRKEENKDRWTEYRKSKRRGLSRHPQ